MSSVWCVQCTLWFTIDYLHQQRGDCVIVLSVCLSFVLSFCKPTNAETDVDQTWPAWTRGDPLQVINFWWWSGSACRLWITFSVFSPLQNRRLFNIYLHCLYNQWPICTILGEMTSADKIMHPQHFGTDPMDIRIQINPKIRIWIPDHFCFTFWRWRRFALSECSCCCFDCTRRHHNMSLPISVMYGCCQLMAEARRRRVFLRLAPYPLSQRLNNRTFYNRRYWNLHIVSSLPISLWMLLTILLCNHNWSSCKHHQLVCGCVCISLWYHCRWWCWWWWWLLVL